MLVQYATQLSAPVATKLRLPYGNIHTVPHTVLTFLYHAKLLFVHISL